MRIQEMRSGQAHLKKKVSTDETRNFFTHREAREVVFDDAPARVVDLAVPCELEEPHWSVVSFDTVEAGGLTYHQAAALMAELDANDISGLCIVTDNAARASLLR